MQNEILTDPFGKLLYAALIGLVIYLLKKYDKSFDEKINALKSANMDLKNSLDKVSVSVVEYEAKIDAHYLKCDKEIMRLKESIHEISLNMNSDYSSLKAKAQVLTTKVDSMSTKVNYASEFITEHYGKIIWIKDTHKKNDKAIKDLENGLSETDGIAKKARQKADENREIILQGKKVIRQNSEFRKAIKAELARRKKKGG